MVFTYSEYYPNGGWCDFLDSFDSLEDAIKAAVTDDHQHVVDLETGLMVWSSNPFTMEDHKTGQIK